MQLVSFAREIGARSNRNPNRENTETVMQDNFVPLPSLWLMQVAVSDLHGKGVYYLRVLKDGIFDKKSTTQKAAARL